MLSFTFHEKLTLNSLSLSLFNTNNPTGSMSFRFSNLLVLNNYGATLPSLWMHDVLSSSHGIHENRNREKQLENLSGCKMCNENASI